MINEQDVAVVTGAARGIGRALVGELLSRGARKVYAVGRSDGILQSFAAQAGKVVPLIADVSSPEQVRRIAAQSQDATLVFSNAGVLDFGSILETSDEVIERNLATNLFGQLNVARAYAPVLERNGRGHLVNLLTVVALASMPALAPYNLSKAAAWSMTQSLRADLGKRGVQVHAVFPGPVDTDMAAAITFPKTSPSEVARAILDGIDAGQEDIFPDPMSRNLQATWSRDPKAVERNFGAM